MANQSRGCAFKVLAKRRNRDCAHYVMLKRTERTSAGGGTGAASGEIKRVSIAENHLNIDLRQAQEDILSQIRNRDAFPLRKVSRSHRYLQEESKEFI